MFNFFDKAVKGKPTTFVIGQVLEIEVRFLTLNLFFIDLGLWYFELNQDHNFTLFHNEER